MDSRSRVYDIYCLPSEGAKPYLDRTVEILSDAEKYCREIADRSQGQKYGILPRWKD